MDEPTALYWQAQSSNLLGIWGKSFPFGFGYGIAVNKNNMALVVLINQAITIYQKSKQFKIDYDRYLSYF